MRAADDFAAIRARMVELQREHREPEQPPGRDRRKDHLDWVDPKRVEEVERIIARGKVISC